MRVLDKCVALIGALGLSACSPYVYNTEIGAFSTGVTSVSSAYATGLQSMQTDAAAKQDQAFIAARGTLGVTPGCDDIAPGPDGKFPLCAIIVAGELPPADQNVAYLVKDAPAFNALKAYAAGLAAVTNAGDDATLTTASNGLEASANGLAQEVTKLHPAAAGPAAITKAAGPLFALGVQTYLDQQRYNTLRTVVPAMDNQMAAFSENVKAALLLIQAVQLNELRQAIDADQAQLEPSKLSGLSADAYKTLLTDLEAKIAAFNTARASDPGDAADKLKTAHHALSVALLNNTGQSKAVFDATTAFLNAAGAVDTAVSAAAKPVTVAKKAS